MGSAIPSVLKFPRAVFMYIGGVSEIFMRNGNMEVTATEHGYPNVQGRLVYMYSLANWVYVEKEEAIV